MCYIYDGVTIWKEKVLYLNISMKIFRKRTLKPNPPNLGSIFCFSMVMTPRGVPSKTRDTYDRYL
jgi:hypothetical protein